MAAVEESPVVVTAVKTSTEAKAEKVEKLIKVEKPDEEKYKKDLAEAEKQLATVTEKMVRFPPPTNVKSGCSNISPLYGLNLMGLQAKDPILREWRN
jgi:hypothetical protein